MRKPVNIYLGTLEDQDLMQLGSWLEGQSKKPALYRFCEWLHGALVRESERRKHPEEPREVEMLTVPDTEWSFGDHAGALECVTSLCFYGKGDEVESYSEPLAKLVDELFVHVSARCIDILRKCEDEFIKYMQKRQESN